MSDTLHKRVSPAAEQSDENQDHQEDTVSVEVEGQ